MKNFIFSVLTILTMSTAFSQNGGQQNFNASIKIEFAGFYGSQTVIKATSFQSCTAIAKFSQTGNSSVLQYKTLPANGFDTIHMLIPITNHAKIQANMESGCNGFESGVVELNLDLTAMPIILTSWTAKVDKTDSALVHLAWSVDMESNVAYYRIDGSTDYGKTWDTGIAKLNSLGDTNLKRDYKLTYYNPLIGMIVKTAGIGIFGMVLVIAIFAGSLRNRALAGTLACLMLVTTIACKKDVTAPKQGLKYNAVKLNEVDKDGSVKDFATRQLK
jgi:hypothetical protein